MAEVAVRKLVVQHPDLEDPVAVDLVKDPDDDKQSQRLWDLLPKEARKRLDRLDKNDDGELLYCAESTYAEADPSCELTYSDGSSDTFFRLFWAFEGDAFHNDFILDEKSRFSRRYEAERIQDKIYSQVVLPLLKDPNNLDRWDEARKLLVTMADPEGLFRLAREQAFAQWEKGYDPKFLFLMEEILLEAKRLAAATRWGRKEDYENIVVFLGQVQEKLEQIENERFKKAIKKPYLLAGPGAPVTVALGDLKKDNRIILRVSIPSGFKKKEVLAALNAQKPRLKPSRFRGAQGTDEYELVAKALINSRSIEKTSSLIDRISRLSAVLFGEKREYLYVSFSLKDPGAIPEDRDIQKFDLLTDIDDKGTVREIPGSVVLQNKDSKEIEPLPDPDLLTDKEEEKIKKEINIVFAADIHANERDDDIRKEMIDSLIAANKYQNREVVERIERFYEPINEKLEAAVEQWNKEYREGKLDYVVFAGDLVDFINIATTAKDQGYRGTNVRRLVHIVSKIEAPVYMKPGNHDPHIYPFPISEHRQSFADDPGLYKYFAKHYDDHHFSAWLPMKLHALKDLLPRRFEDSRSESGELDFIYKAMQELLSGDPYKRPSDEGMGPYYRYLETNEAEVTPLGNNYYLYNWKTNEEYFNQQRWAFEEVNEPVGLNLIRSFDTYVFSQHVNGKGPRPEVFRHFLRTVEEVQKKGGRLIVAQHYPLFYLGSGTDSTADSEDALRGDPNWALRMVSWYYKNETGESTIDLIVAGHVHRYGEYDLDFKFSKEEEEHFKEDLESLLDSITIGEVDDNEIYDQFDGLRKKYKLDEHFTNDRYLDSSNGFPRKVVKAYNKDAVAFGRERGTAFVNLPAIGPASADSPSGYLKLTINPDGKKTLMPYFFYLESDGTVLRDKGENLPKLKKIHRERIRQWKLSHGEKNPKVPKDEDGFKAPPDQVRGDGNDGAYGGPPFVDTLPLLTQYPKGKIGLSAFVGFGGGWGVHDLQHPYSTVNIEVGLRATLPLSNRHEAILTPLTKPNYLRFGAKYWSRTDDWLADMSVGYGLFEPHVFTGLDFGSSDNIYGFGLSFGEASGMVIPVFNLSTYTTENMENWAFQVSAIWEYGLYTFHLRRSKHHHGR